MAYTTIDDPSQHFDILTRSGVYDSSGTYDLTGLNFKPDFVWEKVRSVSGDHYLQNSSLTGKKMLKSNSTAAENTDGNIESYLSNGIQINRQYDWNSSRTLVDWFWKANGGTTSSNTDGTITSTVQANTTAGFSIVTYTGTQSNATVGHGLGAVPSWIITKCRSSSNGWPIFHHKNTSAPETDYLVLNLNNATGDSSGVWNDTAPTSSVFSVGTANSTNGSSDQQIAYCFAEKKGYSKYGVYKGNGNADGTFIYTGFRPAWIVVKPIDVAQNWQIHDTKRLGYNVTNKNLSFNNTAAEAENDFMDILSNGFKIRRADVLNVSDDEYIYWAFAESPFVNSKGVPTNAR